MWVKVENRTTILGSMIPRAGEDYFPPLFGSIKAKTGRHEIGENKEKEVLSTCVANFA